MGIRLLLADDSPTISKILKMALQTENYEICSVLTAQEALKELTENPPFFFLVDLTLPEKSGYEFAKMIRSDAKLNNIKVILLSSAFDPADPALVAESGADGVIVKPFDPSELRNTLSAIAKEPTKQLVTPTKPEHSSIESLSIPAETIGDANDILSQLAPKGENTGAKSFSRTAEIAFDEEEIHLDQENTPREPVLDLSNSFQPSIAKNEAELSPNAQALAAFFEAEITKSPTKTDPVAENYQASLSSIEWPDLPEKNLKEWSRSDSVATSNAKKIPPIKQETKIATPTNESLLFDTGNSTFRFSEDYTSRITRAFTGDLNEAVPAKQESFFEKESHDTQKEKPLRTGGPWSAEETLKIEQLVREEVQMVVREVVEKIAWEVIPELAENLIKKELEKVLKQIDN